MASAKNNKTKASTNKYKCTCCGNEYTKQTGNFYKSYSFLYKANNSYLTVCIDCMVNIYDMLMEEYKSEEYVVNVICKRFDSYFNVDLLASAKEQATSQNSSLIRIYYQKINSLSQCKNLTNKDSLKVDEEQLKHVDIDDKSELIELTDEDKIAKKDCIRLLGYDPFAGYSKFDQKFLYGELLPYLNEDVLEDQFMLSQIIQILNNNNQIRKIDLAMANITSNPESISNRGSDLKVMSDIKNKIVNSNDKIAKENSISVKNRGDKKAGKTTLTYMMKNLRELGFEDAEHDYYDHMKAIGMKRTADISNKSILEQLQFDENEYLSMIKEQREMIQRLQEKLDNIEEENRQLHVKTSNIN